MKKTLLTLALVAATAASSFGQGKILFGNDSLHLYTIAGIGADAAINGPVPVSPLPSGLSLVAALYAGTSSGSLSLQTAITLTGTDWLTDGRQANKNVVLTGISGGAAVNFTIVFLDSAATRPATIDGTLALQALRNTFTGNTYWGSSGLFTAVPGTSLSYPGIATAASQSTWGAGALAATAAPEPTTMVLAGLGAASLLMFRRRK